MVWHETDLLTVDYAAKVSDDERTIGKYIAEMVEDKSTLQMGIGTDSRCCSKFTSQSQRFRCTHGND